MVLSFSILPTGIRKTVGHPLKHNFDFPSSWGTGGIPRKSRVYLKYDMERNKEESRRENFVHVAQRFSPHFSRATFPLCNNVCV